MVHELLTKDLALISKLIDKELIKKIEKWFLKWREKSSIEALKSGEIKEALLIFLLEKTTQLLEELDLLHKRHNSFRKKFVKAIDDKEKQDVVIEFATHFEYFKTSLYEEQNALERWLFDDAIDERFEKIEIKLKKTIIFLIGRVGHLFKEIVQEKELDSQVQYWNQVDILSYLKPLLTIKSDKEILIATLTTITTALSSLNLSNKEELFEQQEEKFIYRLSLESSQDVWVQSAALALLLEISKESFLYASTRRLDFPKEGDDIFVRHRLFASLHELEFDDELLSLYKKGLKDTSPFVR